MGAIKGALRAEDGIVCVDFDAWRFEREPQLLIPLLDIIRTELHEQAKATPNAQKVGEVTGRLGRVVSALAHGLSGSVGIPGAVTVNTRLTWLNLPASGPRR